MRITVIGSGNMGGALIKGWAKAFENMEGENSITITAHSQKTIDSITAECKGVTGTTDNRKAVLGADVIVMAVKPWIFPQVAKEISGCIDFENQLVVSVAANIFNEDIEKAFASDNIRSFYCMPNIAAEYGESMTFIAPSPRVTEEDTELVDALFSLVGKTMVCEERLISSGMMMAGCGIAYVMRFIRAMMEGGVEMGFYPKDAKEIALQTMLGAVTLLNETGLHPEAAIDKVTTPGGVTIKGLNELDHAAFSSAVIRCLKAGLKK